MGPPLASSVCLDGWWGEAIFKTLCVYLYRPRLLCSPRGFLLEGIYLTHCVLPLWGNKEEKILKLGCFAEPHLLKGAFLSPISSLHLWCRKKHHFSHPCPSFRAIRNSSFFMQKSTSDICFEQILPYLGTSHCSRICLWGLAKSLSKIFSHGGQPAKDGSHKEENTSLKDSERLKGKKKVLFSKCNWTE